MKKCSFCRKTKPLSLFSKNKSHKDGRGNWCKKCMTQYTRNHYQNNKETYISRAKIRTRKISEKTKQFLIELKDNKPCVDCKAVHRYFALDYDHREASSKVNNVGNLYVYGQKKLLEEINKCDLVCATCHRYRSHKRNVNRKRK